MSVGCEVVGAPTSGGRGSDPRVAWQGPGPRRSSGAWPNAMRGRRLAAALGALLGTAGFGLVAIPGPLCEPAAAARAGGPPAPNIVLVMTDDQAGSQVGPLYLPRITRLLQGEGTTFDNAFLTTPLCCPSRASLLTGQYGHNNGVLTNSYRYLRAQRNVLPAWLRRAGYVTAHVGRFLNRYQRQRPPDRRGAGLGPVVHAAGHQSGHLLRLGHVEERQRGATSAGPQDYAPRVFERAAVRVTRRFVPRARPIYLQVDEIAPHPGLHQREPGCGAIPDPRDVGKRDDVELPRPPSLNEANMRDKPRFLRRQPPLGSKEINRMTRRYRCGLASCSRSTARWAASIASPSASASCGRRCQPGLRSRGVASARRARAPR